jgi:aspartyl-tRNA(Asn)/glutamyl-tRNA(Gln) amidotransferase subunit A
MTAQELAYKPITELAQLIRSREISPVELVQTYLERIERYDGFLKSYITVCREEALQAAREAEKAVLAGQGLGPLHGIPIALKDQFFTRGIRTTCGSRIWSEFVPDYDATVVAKLREAGAIILGKLNMTEWATPLTLNFPYGQPRNPWNPDHDAGGSSTGSGIAPAAGLCAGAMGEDTGGSIRRPASYNSCVGLRPSWGRVSVHGVVPGSWSQDTAGPLTRTVADCALLLKAIAGYDPKDNVSANLPVPDYLRRLDGEVKGMRIGVIREALYADFIHPEVQAGVQTAAKLLEGLGATVEEVSIPLLPLTGVLSAATGSERTAFHWSYLMTRPRDFDAAVRKWELIPGLLPAGLYQRAMQARSLVRAQVLGACNRYSVLLSAALPAPPPTIEETKRPLRTREEASAQLKRFSFAAPSTVSATPAISIPGGFTRAGLPFGIQIIAKRFDEESVFRVAHAYEQHTEWHTRRPPLP